MDELPLLCHRCGCVLHAGSGDFYVVRIDAVADPTPPHFTSEDLDLDTSDEIGRLIDEISERSEQELADDIYRRLAIYLCRPCFRRWIENPVG